MSGTFYHLDRRNELDPEQTIQLESALPDAPDGEELPVESLFPRGLTSHGRHYCTQDLYADDDDELWDVSCELVFELVRAARFPDRPSRFQSVFGFEAMRDVERFVDSYVDPPYTVWRVTADRSFTADMKLVDAEDVAHGARQADYYWRGRTYVDRPLWEGLLVPPVEVKECVESMSE
jgi:hypothetical protein